MNPQTKIPPKQKQRGRAPSLCVSHVSKTAKRGAPGGGQGMGAMASPLVASRRRDASGAVRRYLVGCVNRGG